MNKKELEVENKELVQTIANLDRHVDQLQSQAIISHDEHDKLLCIENTYNEALQEAAEYRKQNRELIGAIAVMNGGVVKDLSQAIVNLTANKSS